MTTQSVKSEVRETDQDDLNEELLSGSEISVLLLDAYRTAVNLDPRLRSMAIIVIEDPLQELHGYATPADLSESGKHEIHIRLNNLDNILGDYTDMISDYPTAVEIICLRLNIDLNEVTPQLLYVHSILHEMGHVAEYMDYEDRMDVLRLRNKQERSSLPLGYISLTRLMDTSSELRKGVEAQWDEISSRHGVSDIHELARLQAKAYRNLTSELKADMFAVYVFGMNPQLFEQLSQPTVDAYRNVTLTT